MKRIAIYSGIAAAAVALGLFLTSCASQNLTPQEKAIQEVAAASDSVALLATAADTAIKTGVIHKGDTVTTDIRITIDAASAALVEANNQLHAGNTGGVDFYLQQAATLLSHVYMDFSAAHVTVPSP